MPWSFKTKLLDFPISSLPVPCLGRRRPVHQHFPPLPQLSAPLQGQLSNPLGEKLCLLFSSKTYLENTQNGDENCSVNFALYLKLFSLKVWFDQLCWVHTKWAIDIHHSCLCRVSPFVQTYLSLSLETAHIHDNVDITLICQVCLPQSLLYVIKSSLVLTSQINQEVGTNSSW